MKKPLSTWRGGLSATLLSMLMLTVALPAARAHDGEVHDHAEPAAAAPADSGPRVARQTEDFELVAVLNGSTLTLYLDHVDTNEPVKDAKVELDSAAFKATASQQSPGVYTATASALLKPGRYPMTVSVDVADKADLIDVTWDTAVDEGEDAGHEGSRDGHGHLHHPAHRPSGPLGGHPWAWGFGVAAVLAAIGLLLRARARSRLKHASGDTPS